ncbi:hypothetical protein PAXINDRAFT_99835 [Paxillus involutus ATCC 200175]|uniref:Uncharacterized protein n=1 Tax=Paxillus involutus ATCC 200175 TaxID=664439 RepID=A0A0C9TGF8_PAXIN|nr:hypothetical protein PAXINDRAFT_99835 [Paxillus involutus ATCC 200175]
MHTQWSSHSNHRGRRPSTAESNMAWSTSSLSSSSISQAPTSVRVPQGLSSHGPQTTRQSLRYAIERQQPHVQDATYPAISQSYVSLSSDTGGTMAQRLYASSLPKPPAALPVTLQTRDEPAFSAPPSSRPQLYQARHSGLVDESSGVADVVVLSPVTIQSGEYQEQDAITVVLAPSGDGFAEGLSQLRGELSPSSIQRLPSSSLEHHSPHEHATSRPRLSTRVTGPRRPSIRLDSVPEHRNFSSQSPLTHDVHFPSVPDPPQEDIPSYSVVDNTPPPPDFEENPQTSQIVGHDPRTRPSSSPRPLNSPAALSRAPTYALIDPRSRTSAAPSQHTEDLSSSTPSSSRNSHSFSNWSPSNAERPRNTSTTSSLSVSKTIQESAGELYGASYSSFSPVRSKRPAAQRPSPHIRPPLTLFPSLSSPVSVASESSVNGPTVGPALPFPTSESLLETSHSRGSSIQLPRAISLPAPLPPLSANHRPPDYGPTTSSVGLPAPLPALSANHRPPDPGPTTSSVGSHDSQLPTHKLRKPPKRHSSNTMLSHPSGAFPQQQVAPPSAPRPTFPNGPYQRSISEMSPASLGSQQVVVQQAQAPQRPSPNPHPPAQQVDVQRATQHPAAPHAFPPQHLPQQPPNYQPGPPNPRPTPHHHVVSHNRHSYYHSAPPPQGTLPPQTIPPPMATTQPTAQRSTLHPSPDTPAQQQQQNPRLSLPHRPATATTGTRAIGPPQVTHPPQISQSRSAGQFQDNPPRYQDASGYGRPLQQQHAGGLPYPPDWIAYNEPRRAQHGALGTLPPQTIPPPMATTQPTAQRSTLHPSPDTPAQQQQQNPRLSLPHRPATATAGTRAIGPPQVTHPPQISQSRSAGQFQDNPPRYQDASGYGRPLQQQHAGGLPYPPDWIAYNEPRRAQHGALVTSNPDRRSMLGGGTMF